MTPTKSENGNGNGNGTIKIRWGTIMAFVAVGTLGLSIGDRAKSFYNNERTVQIVEQKVGKHDDCIEKIKEKLSALEVGQGVTIQRLDDIQRDLREMKHKQ
jgi:vacuolar-type H+-ATPase catalytic subunit A/Vma1